MKYLHVFELKNPLYISKKCKYCGFVSKWVNHIEFNEPSCISDEEKIIKDLLE